EQMVLVRARPAARAEPAGTPVITIEPTSATWRAIHPLLRARHAELLLRPLIPVESFGAVLQMARAGFGDGIVPLGLVDEARLPARAVRPLSGVVRRVALSTRKTVHQSAGF